MSELTKVEGIIDEIEGLTVKELNELVKGIEEKFGVSAASFAVASGGAAAGGGADAKSEYAVHLAEVGAKKMNVIKVVREISGLGLKEAKDLVDNAPKLIKDNVPDAEAQEMKKKLEEAGAKVELK